jgi:hypothetical protein
LADRPSFVESDGRFTSRPLRFPESDASTRIYERPSHHTSGVMEVAEHHKNGAHVNPSTVATVRWPTASVTLPFRATRSHGFGRRSDCVRSTDYRTPTRTAAVAEVNDRFAPRVAI